jgi:predicted membrane protein
VLCLIGGLAFIVGWLWQSGMEPRMIALFLPAALVIYIAIAKFVCESGTLYIGAPISAQDFALQIFGSRSFSASSITATAFSSCLSWMLFMTPLSMSAKLADMIRANKRRLFWAVCAALVSGLAVNITLTIYYGYRIGAYNFYDYPFVRYAPSTFDGAVAMLQDPYVTSWPRILFFLAGAIFVSLLMLLRYRFPGWPFHPVGFIVATTSILHVILSLFLVWCFKAIVMRVGGVALYRKFRPLFIGIILGRVFGVTLSFLIDYFFFPGQGHYVHGWV